MPQYRVHVLLDGWILLEMSAPNVRAVRDRVTASVLKDLVLVDPSNTALGTVKDAVMTLEIETVDADQPESGGYHRRKAREK